MTTKQRRQEWIACIADYKTRRLTMVAWCAAQHVTKTQLKYWLRKLKDEVHSEDVIIPTRWVPLTVANSIQSTISAPPLFVHIGQAHIEIRTGFDPRLLREVVQALEAPCQHYPASNTSTLPLDQQICANPSTDWPQLFKKASVSILFRRAYLCSAIASVTNSRFCIGSITVSGYFTDVLSVARSSGQPQVQA